MTDIEIRKSLVDALGTSWKKRLITTRLALIDGRKPLYAAGAHPECLGSVVETIDSLLKGDKA